VRASGLWRRAQEAELRLAEHPFVLEREDGRFLEGVIDLAFRDEEGWTVVDYKTDRGDDPDAEARHERYREQLRLYGEALEALTGEPVGRRVLWFLRGERAEVVEEG
jgi:ATP-dependent helicase/nuclease subunit A